MCEEWEKRTFATVSNGQSEIEVERGAEGGSGSGE